MKSTSMRPVFMRLPTDLVEELKLLAELHDAKYQALIRQVLTQYAASERCRLDREEEVSHA